QPASGGRRDRTGSFPVVTLPLSLSSAGLDRQPGAEPRNLRRPPKATAFPKAPEQHAWPVPNGIKGRCKSFPTNCLRFSFARQFGHHIDISLAPCGLNLGIFRYCKLVNISMFNTRGPSEIDRKYKEAQSLHLA